MVLVDRQIVGQMLALPRAGRPSEHGLAAHADDARNASAPRRLVDVERAHGVDAERHVVRGDAVGRNAGQMQDRVLPFGGRHDGVEVFDIADQCGRRLRRRRAVERRDVVTMRFEFADDPPPELSGTAGHENSHGPCGGVIRSCSLPERRARPTGCRPGSHRRVPMPLRRADRAGRCRGHEARTSAARQRSPRPA